MITKQRSIIKLVVPHPKRDRPSEIDTKTTNVNTHKQRKRLF